MKSNYPNPAQVWQRVYPKESGELQTLQGLLQQLKQDRAFLQQILGDDPLVREYGDQFACVKGVLMLTGGTPPRSTAVSKVKLTLTECYHHALHRLAAYQLRSSDPVYGPVFRNLAQQTERHCRLIVQIIGQK
jgi:hypothetical protein